MAGEKITDLPAALSLSAGDLLLASVEISPGIYQSQSVDFSVLQSALVVNLGNSNLNINTSGVRSVTLNNGLTSHSVDFLSSSGDQLFTVNGSGFANSNGGTNNVSNTIFGYGTKSAGYTLGYENVILGYFAGSSITSAQGNVFLGKSTGQNVTSGYSNMLFGRNAGLGITTGNRNIAIGENNLANANGSASLNVALGTATLYNTTSDNDIGIGVNVLTNYTAGGTNVAIGYYALNSLLTGQQNVAIGYICGGGMTTGEQNTLIGNLNGMPATMNRHVIIADGGGSRAITKDDGQNIRFGSTTTAMLSTATNGFIYVRGGAGTPTSVPAVTGGGQFPMYWDSTNEKFYIYNAGGTGWVAIN